MNPFLLLLIVLFVLGAGVLAGALVFAAMVRRVMTPEVADYALALGESIRLAPADLGAKQRANLRTKTATLEKVNGVARKAQDPSYKLTEADVDTLMGVILDGIAPQGAR